MVSFVQSKSPGKRTIRNRLAMPRVCPRCKSNFGDEAQCPTCGFHVATPPEVRRPPRRRAATAPSKWQQTAWGKTLIGLLLAQGLYYGLLMLVRTIASASGEELSAEWMTSFNGLLLIQVMQLISLLAGGMVAGAGQRRGVLYGAVVGLYNGVLFLLVHVQILGHSLRPEVLATLPVLQIAFGTAGGFIGNRIWKPIEPLQTLPADEGSIGAAAPRAPADIAVPAAKLPKVSPLAGPINWFRVAGGTFVAVLGTYSAPPIFKAILNASADIPPLDTQRQAMFLTWEISVLAILIGGSWAGSNSSNGLKQGLVVGVISSFMLAVILLWRGDSSATDTTTLLFSLFGFKGTALAEKVVFTVLSVLPLGIAGGWFGGQLLPPVILPPRHKRMLPGSV
jgi:hypothetical protein